MKKMLGLAAAALMLSAGAASAGTTNVNVSLLGFSCTATITTFADKRGGQITKPSLLTGSASSCGFAGLGTVGKVKIATGDTRNIATLVGTTSYVPSYKAVMVLLDYPFVTGGTYWSYYTTDGVKWHYVNKGTYSVSP